MLRSPATVVHSSLCTALRHRRACSATPRLPCRSASRKSQRVLRGDEPVQERRRERLGWIGVLVCLRGRVHWRAVHDGWR